MLQHVTFLNINPFDSIGTGVREKYEQTLVWGRKSKMVNDLSAP